MNKQFVQIDDNKWINLNNVEKIIKEGGYYLLCTINVPYPVNHKYDKEIEKLLVP